MFISRINSLLVDTEKKLVFLSMKRMPVLLDYHEP